MRKVLVSFFLSLSLVSCLQKSEKVIPDQKGEDVYASPVGSMGSRNNARYAGMNYSQSVSVADANAMIGSYLASVNYPSQDSALRSLTFDADTLRAYLNDTSIKTLKFFLAHRPAWAIGNTYGRYSGYKPSAMTMVAVGLSENDQYILNNRNEVYEHFFPCPHDCPNSGSDALINSPVSQ